MNYPTKTEVLEVAERVLTAKQYDVFRLSMNGLGAARIGIMLDISEPVARRTVKRAMQLVEIELRKEAA
jgi:DNA-binding CsgD family transcriptional regulator